ncbi:DUF4433 domain-containing protein [Gordonia sp. CPCC 206044]|uniref:type II toxin-antitoxin system toxin DNA ADP-ribosyl transferase DarT n=1 Tax=Gordonia sp. CPCC 206044 TaxID=3140793 RepID=UPI003AF34216
MCHFTHIEHLPAIVEHGLVADTVARSTGYLTHEAGEPRIKERRSRRTVDAGPGGVVADYVPFYFRSRSPMLFSINRGNVPSFTGDSHDLIYLMTSIEVLNDQGLRLVFSDRNAVLAVTAFSDDIDDLDSLVDWDVIAARYWAGTPDDPDRVERRMAECLVHRHVPWEAFTGIAVYDTRREHQVLQILDRMEKPHPPVTVVPNAYF